MKKITLIFICTICILGCSDAYKYNLQISKPKNLIIVGNEYKSETKDSVRVLITLSFNIINKTNKELGGPIIYVSDEKRVYAEGGEFIYFKDSTFNYKELSNMASINVTAKGVTECYLGIHKLNLSKQRMVELNPKFKEAVSQERLKEPLYWYTDVSKFLESPDIAEKMKNVNDSIHVIFFRKKNTLLKKGYNNIILKEKINYR